MLNATCREVHNLLELFFDSELEPRQMRTVALHSATCPSCEEELRHLERLQDVLSRTVQERVDEVDVSVLWGNIEQRLQPRRPSIVQRVRDWWGETEWGWGVPAMGGALAAAALAALILVQPGGDSPDAVRVADNSANPVSVHEIDTDSHVALLSEADTLLLWVDHQLDEGTITASEPVNFEDYE